MEPNNMYSLFLGGFFDPTHLLHVLIHSFLLLSNIPLHRYTTICLSTYLLIEILIFSLTLVFIG